MSEVRKSAYDLAFIMYGGICTNTFFHPINILSSMNMFL